MRAGGLEWYKLTVYEPTTAVNEFGEESLSYAEVNTVHAWRAKMRSNYHEEVAELFPDYSVEWYVRTGAVPGVSEGWRVQQLGGYLYTVTNIDPNLKRGYVSLTCQRVNE